MAATFKEQLQLLVREMEDQEYNHAADGSHYQTAGLVRFLYRVVLLLENEASDGQ